MLTPAHNNDPARGHAEAEKLAREAGMLPIDPSALKAADDFSRAIAEASRRNEQQMARFAQFSEEAAKFKSIEPRLPRFREPRWDLVVDRLNAWATGDILGKLEEIRGAIERARVERDADPEGKGDATQKLAVSNEALAIALLVEHSDWTVAEIADAVGVNRTTLYKWPSFRKAWSFLRDGRSELPRGEKDEDGNLEAEA
jgi:hypothetical protein